MRTLLPSSASRAADRAVPAAAAGTGPVGFAESGRPADAVRAEIAELCADDVGYAGGGVVNSISSAPVPLAAETFAAHLEVNGGDNRIFPSVPRCEQRVTRMLGDLLDHPDAAGVATSGGTEANLLAVESAVRRWREASTGPAPVLIGDNAHFSFDKILGLLPVTPVRVPAGADQRVDPRAAVAAVRPGLALVVLTAGTSECGAVDDVGPVAAAAAAAGVPVHVDAATGGFLVPFARELGHPLPYCGFGLPGVTSVTVDPHKYGGAPIPAGHLLFRDAADLHRLRTRSHYRGTTDHFGLLGTRPGAAVLATYAGLRHLGRAGYREQAARLFALRDHLVDRLGSSGHRLAFRPDLLVVGVRHPAPDRALEFLQERGVVASVARRLGLLRLVVQRHHRTEHLDRVVELLDEHRSSQEASP